MGSGFKTILSLAVILAALIGAVFLFFRHNKKEKILDGPGMVYICPLDFLCIYDTDENGAVSETSIKKGSDGEVFISTVINGEENRRYVSEAVMNDVDAVITQHSLTDLKEPGGTDENCVLTFRYNSGEKWNFTSEELPEDGELLNKLMNCFKAE